MLLASIIQFRHSKMSILRSYQENMFLGSGLNGIDKASLAIFGKYASSLDWGEAAFIAAMMVYPKPMTPNASWQNKVSRRLGYGLKLMPRLKDSLDKAYARHLA
jgi:membrane peptidoglycan carboxypeptidase